MFAPSSSRPPYYPSYLPPEPEELSALFQSKAYMPLHGQGALHETWKIQHGVYLNEQKDVEMASAEMQRATTSLLDMQNLLKGHVTRAAAAASASSSGAPASSGPSSNLIYTDPLGYGRQLERQNLSLFSMVSLSSDHWAQLKNTPFLRYLYEGIFALDVGRLDTEWFGIAMQFLDRTPNIHTLLLHDGWHMSVASSGGSKSSSATRSRAHLTREKHSLLGGGSAGGASKGSATGAGAEMKRYPDERRILEGIETHLPAFLARNAPHLVHVELHGLLLTNWDEVISRGIRRCTNLQRLYLKGCNIGDAMFAQELCPAIRTNLGALTHLQLSRIGLTASSATQLCNLVKSQSEKRNTLHWESILRQPISLSSSSSSRIPAPSSSLLLPSAATQAGLVSLDLSENALGDRGVQMVSETLGRDTWLKAVDLSANGVGEGGLRGLVDMLEQNASLMWVQIQGPRELNVNLCTETSTAAANANAAAAAAAAAAGVGSPRRSVIPRVGNLSGSAGASIRNAAVSTESSARLLQQVDPHWPSRSKRLLLLFHQQQLETEKFLTGHDPLQQQHADLEQTAARNLSPRRRHQQPPPPSAPIAPDAATVFDRFFKPASSLPMTMHSGSFDNQPLPSPTRPTSAKKASMKSSPSASVSAAAAASPTKPRVPQPAALNFLFPHLQLVCAPERLLVPDIALRSKPPRTDTTAPAGWEPHASPSSSSKRRTPSASPAGRKSAAAAAAPTTPAAATAAAAAATTSFAQDYSHLDFRPLLRETCVASTSDYIAAEKAAYKRRLRAREGRQLIEKLSSAGSPRVSVRIEEQEEESKQQQQQQQQQPEQPYSPIRRSSTAAAFSPSRSAPAAMRMDRDRAATTAAAQNLLEENARLAEEMQRLEAKRRENERILAQQSPTPPPQPLELQSRSEQSSPLPPMAALPSLSSLPPSAPASAAASSVASSVLALPPFDAASVESVLSLAAVAASHSPVQDPVLLAYLEAQFQKLHAYFDLLESAPEEQLQHAVATTPPPQHWQPAQPVREGEDHKETAEAGVALPSQRKHHTVQRADQSPSPSITAASSEDNAPAATPSRPLVSRSGSFDDSSLPSQLTPPQSQQQPPQQLDDSSAAESQQSPSSQQPSSLLEQPSRSPADPSRSRPASVEVEEEIEIVDESVIQQELQSGVVDRLEDLFGLDDD